MSIEQPRLNLFREGLPLMVSDAHSHPYGYKVVRHLMRGRGCPEKLDNQEGNPIVSPQIRWIWHQVNFKIFQNIPAFSLRHRIKPSLPIPLRIGGFRKNFWIRNIIKENLETEVISVKLTL